LLLLLLFCLLCFYFFFTPSRRRQGAGSQTEISTLTANPIQFPMAASNALESVRARWAKAAERERDKRWWGMGMV